MNIKRILIEKVDSKLDKVDWIIIFIVCFLYGLLSFYKLGTTKSPQTFIFSDYSYEVYNFKISGDTSNTNKIKYFVGPREGSFKVLASKDNKSYHLVYSSESEESVLNWKEAKISDIKNMKYIQVIADSDDVSLGEISFNGNITLIGLDDESKKLIDEQNTVPSKIDYYNSAYFDEVYYARTAYEYVHGIGVFEWTHPPLGKLIQALPVLLFGLTPFTYRLMGSISGILLVLVMYIFGKALFKNRGYALLASLFMVFDGFHFAMSRLGTVDTFLVLTILTSYYFMWRYFELSRKDSFKKRMLFLFLSGLMISFSIATKWIGLFALAGLGVIFFIHFYNIYIKTKDYKECGKEIINLAIGCIINFILIPIIIYVASYFLFPIVSSYVVNDFKTLFTITKDMYEYHSKLDATHPFSSLWYTWPVMYRPVWLYTITYPNGIHSTISTVGNVAIWWGGIVGVLYSIYRLVRKKEKFGIIIIAVLLCLYLPYSMIGRCMFLYHYFPVLPFTMFALVNLLKGIYEKTKKIWIIFLYLCLVIIIFIYFFPVVSGMPIKSSDIESRKWISEWYF